MSDGAVQENKPLVLKDIKDRLDAEILVGEEDLDLEIGMACGSDLLSDVLAFAKSGSLLLTGLTNSQVIRTAEVADIKAVCFVRGKRPPQEVIEQARKKGIPILFTSLPLYEACGRLCDGGLPGCSQVGDEP